MLAPCSFNVLSLFTGYGGLDLGLGLARPDARIVCCVEREAKAVETLASLMEAGWLDDAPVWSDSRTFDGRPWRGVVDCVIGGYPCQGESSAGKGLGTADPRWLWPHVARIVSEVEPEWCFFENVGAHLSRSFRHVRSDLQAMGYEVAAGLFTASEVGATHKRERLFILAHSSSIDRGLHPGSGAERPGAVIPGRAIDPLADAGRLDRAGRGEPGDMAHAARAAEGDGEQRQRLWDAVSDGGGTLANTHGQRPERLRESPGTANGHGSKTANLPERRGPTLADPSDGGSDVPGVAEADGLDRGTRGQPGPGRHLEPGGRGGALADPERDGLERGEPTAGPTPDLRRRPAEPRRVLADAERCLCGAGSERRGREAGPDSCRCGERPDVGLLADAERPERRTGDEGGGCRGQRCDGDRETPGSVRVVRSTLGHPDGARTDADAAQGPPRGATGESGGDVVDAPCVGRREGRSEPVVRCGRDAARDPDDGLPVFPPGPGDIDAWRTVLASRPDLAPAVDKPNRRMLRECQRYLEARTEEERASFKPAVRRMAHGLAGRVDRLRGCGNGVVPLEAAHAWLTLRDAFGD